MRIFRIQNIYRLIKWMYRMKKSAQIWERVSKGEKESKRARKSARNSDREKAREREKEIKSKLNAMKIKKWETATITVDGNTFNALVAELILFFFITIASRAYHCAVFSGFFSWLCLLIVYRVRLLSFISSAVEKKTFDTHLARKVMLFPLCNRIYIQFMEII